MSRPRRSNPILHVGLPSIWPNHMPNAYCNWLNTNQTAQMVRDMQMDQTSADDSVDSVIYLTSYMQLNHVVAKIETTSAN